MSLLLLLLIVVLLASGFMILLARGATATSRLNRRQQEPLPPAFPRPSAQQPAGPSVAMPPTAVVVRPAARPPVVIRPTAAAPLVITPRMRAQVITIVPQAPLVIIPPPHATWEERGWVMQGNNGTTEYVGEYQITDEQTGITRRFAGRLRATGTKVEAYVRDPPPELYASNGHPKHQCFQPVDPKPGQPVWFICHWATPAKDPDTALLKLEKYLYEAINHRW